MEKPKFPRAEAVPVAQEIGGAIKPYCHRIAVAGSIRRGKAEVGDVEIVYIPKTERRQDPEDMFGTVEVDLATEAIIKLEAQGALARRRNVNGSTVFGPKNKLMEHCETGIPVDLFATTESSWFNYLVCRTGPAESNTRIAMAAQKMGWRWQPYSDGFFRDGSVYPIDSEEKVFRFVGLPTPGRRSEVPL